MGKTQNITREINEYFLCVSEKGTAAMESFVSCSQKSCCTPATRLCCCRCCGCLCCPLRLHHETCQYSSHPNDGRTLLASTQKPQSTSTSREALSRIHFAEMLMISQCDHNAADATRLSTDSIILDLNQLVQVGSMYIGIGATAHGQSHLSAYAYFTHNNQHRIELHETQTAVTADLQLLHEERTEITRFDSLRSSKEWMKSMKCRPHDDACLVSYARSNDIGNTAAGQSIQKLATVLPFILHGVGWMQMRLWVSTGFVGTVEGHTLNIDGQLCRVTYECGHRRPGQLNGAQMNIVRVTQTIRDCDGALTVCKSIYLASGHLVRHKFKWLGQAYVLHLNPMLGVPSEIAAGDFEATQGMKGFLEYIMQAKRQSTVFGAFVENDARVRNLVQFYVLSLIAKKPANVLQYSIEYFMKLGREQDSKHLYWGEIICLCLSHKFVTQESCEQRAKIVPLYR